LSIKNLFMEAPRLCGAAYAAKHAKIAELVWDHEVNCNGFPCMHGETGRQRIEFLFDWSCMDEKKREYCLNLAHLNELAHYAAEHQDAEAGIEADELTKRLTIEELQYPDVAKVLSVQTASRGWWGD